MKRFFILTCIIFWFVSAKIPIQFPADRNILVNLNQVQAAQTNIWTQMRKNSGYIVLLRHAKTVPGTGDPPGFQLDDCATQRNLSEEGREQAKRIGREFRDRNIPIRQVLSSQYCRCLDTARLLNLGTVEPSPILNSIFEDRTTATQQIEQTRQQIIDHRNERGVIVMVSHYANIVKMTGIPLQEGEIVVATTNEQGNLTVAERIKI